MTPWTRSKPWSFLEENFSGGLATPAMVVVEAPMT